MKKTIQNTISFLGLFIFLWTAIGSTSDSFEKCGDPDNVIVETIPESGQISTVNIRLVDKITNEPIPNVSINLQFYLFFVKPSENNNCPTEGKIVFYPLTESTRTTNADGIAEDVVLWSARDKKDNVVGIITIFGETTEYNRAEIKIKLEQDSPNSTFTIPLLKYDLL